MKSSLAAVKKTKVSCMGRPTSPWSRFLSLSTLSVNTSGEILPLLLQWKTTLDILKGFICFFKNFQLTSGKFVLSRADFHGCEWPNIEQIIKPSGHTYPLKCLRINWLLLAQDVGGGLDQEHGVQAGLKAQVFEARATRIKRLHHLPKILWKEIQMVWLDFAKCCNYG